MKINLNSIDLGELDDDPFPKWEKFKAKPKVREKKEEPRSTNKTKSDNYINDETKASKYSNLDRS